MIALPRGSDFLFDLKNIFGPGIVRQMNVVFDVGANTGQSAFHFAHEFPFATVFCFEPGTEAFETLKKNTKNYPNTRIFKIALSNQVGTTVLNVGKETTLASIVHEYPGGYQEPVGTTTLDVFCAQNNIKGIDLLKIDAEGADLLVIDGAKQLLTDKKIVFIQVEASLENEEGCFVLARSVIEKLAPFGYKLFSIYDQMPYLSGKPLLSYFNLVFMNKHLLRW